MRCRGCEWSQPQIQPQAPLNFFSQYKIFPFPSINNYWENFLSLECILRFGSVLLINTLQCFLSIISRPRQEPRHHTVKSQLTVFPSYFQSKSSALSAFGSFREALKIHTIHTNTSFYYCTFGSNLSWFSLLLSSSSALFISSCVCL